MEQFLGTFLISITFKSVSSIPLAMKLTDRCTSCGKGLIERGFVTFPCPICGNPIGRCENCREQGVEYVCENCGFKGP